ncbi:MAG: sigma-54-dependent Fis family transcriptional regulator [Planctomycetota bacterium]|nr:MAG: sigma-54-dependent Fis family transcriptional regulator [Planctomycetota bacterium]
MKVLVVDDKKEIREFLEGFFLSIKEPVKSARNAAGCMEQLRSEEFDVVFLDLYLPDSKGMDTLTRIREFDADIEVIVFTGYASIDSAVKAIKSGAFDFLEKPLSLEKVEIVYRKAAEKVRLNRENSSLRGLVDRTQKVPRLIAVSEEMQKILRVIYLAAPTNSTVLLQGESGTGKEVVAHVIHEKSKRRERPFIAINCGTLQETLLESELFGHEKGAFTGAIKRRQGLFEIADGGTILLDEIGEMTLEIQVKLLRFLQTNEFRPVGSNRTSQVDVRVIAATNKDLQEEVHAGRFREDLFFRLNVITITVPSLRLRKEEIKYLVEDKIERSEFGSGRQKSFSNEAIEVMRRYDWPGNVRELGNVVERALILCPHDVIGVEDLPDYIVRPVRRGTTLFNPALSLAEVEKMHIQAVLEANNSNKLRSAKILGISPKTLYNKIRTYGIEVSR